MAKQKIATSIRLSVIERDNYRCRACGIADVDNLQADHIVPASKGGTINMQNLQTLCGVCNNRKGSTNVGELPIRPADVETSPALFWIENRFVSEPTFEMKAELPTPYAVEAAVPDQLSRFTTVLAEMADPLDWNTSEPSRPRLANPNALCSA